MISQQAGIAAFRSFCIIAALCAGGVAEASGAGVPHADYLYPSDARGGYVIQGPLDSTHSNTTQSAGTRSGKPQATGSGAAATTVSYRAFDGQSYPLIEHRGRYVNVLLPVPSADGGRRFTADHVVELVDRLDMLYALYRELLNREPAGSGLATVAFVPQTCGPGCGLIGARGFEIRADERNYQAIIEELDHGRLDSILLHEMAHNFDMYSGYLHYLPDHAHAWTDMFEYFAPFRYARISGRGEAPDDVYDSPVSAVWKDFVTDESATWQRCVAEADCESLGLSANHLWAMPYYRIEALHGIEPILASFRFLDRYSRLNSPPTTDAAREGLRILSLAVGLGVNISCYLDALKWPVPGATRTDLQRQFGGALVECADRDGDGFAAINGDCDDSDASRNILQPEIAGNGADDDCDGRIDELHLREDGAGNGSGDFTTPVAAQLPFEVSGSTAHADDRDRFDFPLPASGRARVTLCGSDGFAGWAVALRADGSFLESGRWFLYRASAGCSSATFDFGAAAGGVATTAGTTGANGRTGDSPGMAGVAIVADQVAGAYTLAVDAADAALPDYSPLLTVAARATGGMDLVVDDSAGQLAALGADELEVWVSSIAEVWVSSIGGAAPGDDKVKGWVSSNGLQLFEPFDGRVEVRLDQHTAPALEHGGIYQARVRPRRDGVPIAEFSAGHLFRHDAVPAALPVVDHRFSGAWYNPAHDGEGFIVEVLEDQRALVYWFSYTTDGAQRWMLGIGAVAGNRINVDDLLDSSGGRFGSDFDPRDVVLKPVGSLSISFLDCSSALASFSVDHNGANQPLTRLTHVRGHRCNSGSDSDGASDGGSHGGGGSGSDSDSTAGTDLSGSWFDPSHDGEGFIVQQLDAARALVFWFTYDQEGRQAWLYNTGTIDGGGRIKLDTLLQPQGGRFGRSFDPADVVSREWGELELQLSCSGGTARYSTYLEGYSDGQQSLVPLTRLGSSSCVD